VKNDYINQNNLNGKVVDWLEKVTDENYLG
jgi:hypothetical protein